MARFLFAAIPADGHVAPMLSPARELVARGHEVFWFTGRKYRDRVEAVGATYCPMIDAWDIDASNLDEAFPGRADTKGFARFKFDIREIFIPMVSGQVADLERHVAQVRPDVLVAEPGSGAAASVIGRRVGLPWATFGISALMTPSVDTAPFGLGLAPMGGPLGRLRNRVLNALIDRTLFRAVDADYRALCAQLEIDPVPGGIFGANVSPHLYLQPTVPSFEYPRSDLPSQFRFIGPSLPGAGETEFAPPSWWDAMLADERPVVLVTQGTVSTNPQELLLPTLEALRDEAVQVIAVTGGPDPAQLPAPPANARVERFVPFSALMPHVDAYVSNGGYGGLHFALAHGVPMVVAGATEEKPELVARVSWSGVGVGMRTQRAKPAKVRAAVRRILDDPSYRTRAAALQADLAAYDGPSRAAGLLEGLYETAATAGSGALAGVSS